MAVTSVVGLGTRSSAIRETAKWIAAACTGAGAVLFSGLSFTNTAKIAASEDWVLPVALAALPLLAAAWAVRAAAGVVTSEPPGVEQLVPDFARARFHATSQPLAVTRVAELERLLPAVATRYGGVAEYDQRLLAAFNALAEADATFKKTKDPQRERERDQAEKVLTDLQAGVPELVEAADYAAVKRRYGVARWQILGAALVAVAAVAGSGVLAARAEAARAARVPARGPQPMAVNQPTRVVVFFSSGAAAERAGSRSCLVQAGSPAIAVGGTYGRPVLVMNPSVRPAASPGAGSEPMECAMPWTWVPNQDQVVVVPDDAAGGA
jgi:hypothetical protein